MALILSIETADAGCSVAIHQNGELIASQEVEDRQSSSSLLTSIVEEVCADATCEYKDLHAVAISKGPGSYTGLRIGVSTAKGFCYALDLPLISVNTLDSLAWANKTETYDFICPMLDARRMEVYCKLTNAQSLNSIFDTKALVLEVDSFQEYLNRGTILFCGPGANKCKPMLEGGKNVFFEKELTRVHANNMGFLAYEIFRNGNFENLESFEPFYLKDFMVKKSQKKMPLD